MAEKKRNCFYYTCKIFVFLQFFTSPNQHLQKCFKNTALIIQDTYFPFLKRIPSSSPLSFPSVIEGRRSLGAFCKFLTRSISNPHSESLKKPFCCLGVIKNELFVLIKKIMKNRAGRSILEIFKFRQNFRKIKCLFFPNFNLLKRDAVIGGIFLS